MTSERENRSAEILGQLASAGPGGLKKTLLLGKARSKGHAEKLAALESLLDRREIVKLGTEKSPLFVLPKFYNPLEQACASVEAKAIPGTARLYTARELGKGLAKPALEKLAEAIGLLQGGRKLVRLQRAKSVYYVHAVSLWPPVAADAPEPPANIAAPPGTDLSWESFRQAYDSVARASGFSDVLIADLQTATAVPLESLKPFLLAQSRAGRLVPSRGDWSLADAPARAAAIELHGEPYLRVRRI